jgi:predicted MFS family arabinose efflux permease
MAQSVGMTIGPIVGGVVAEYASLNYAFLLGGLMPLLGAGMFVWLARASRQDAPLSGTRSG